MFISYCEALCKFVQTATTLIDATMQTRPKYIIEGVWLQDENVSHWQSSFHFWKLFTLPLFINCWRADLASSRVSTAFPSSNDILCMLNCKKNDSFNNSMKWNTKPVKDRPKPSKKGGFGQNLWLEPDLTRSQTTCSLKIQFRPNLFWSDPPIINAFYVKWIIPSANHEIWHGFYGTWASFTGWIWPWIE